MGVTLNSMGNLGKTLGFTENPRMTLKSSVFLGKIWTLPDRVQISLRLTRLGIALSPTEILKKVLTCTEPLSKMMEPY